MRTYYLEEMTWKEIEGALADGYKTVVIFSGAVEQHGPHLPEATDAIRAHAEAGDFAKRLGKALAAPVIRPGVSAPHMDFPGTITLRPETYKMVIEDYIDSYVQHGFHTFVLASTHGGNISAMEEAAETCREKHPEVVIVTGCNMGDIIQMLARSEAEEKLPKGTCGGHSCDFETSMMLTECDLVQMDKAEIGLMGGMTPEISRKMNTEGIRSVSANGILGDPTGANRERGQRYFEIMQQLQLKIVTEKLERERK